MGEGRRAALSLTRRRRSGTCLLAGGFFLFGFALSWTAGLTQQAGIGATLLSGFFSFVGGAFLSFAGFRIREKGSIDPARLGACLMAVSCGVIAGGPLAFFARRAFAREASADAGAGVQRSQSPEQSPKMKGEKVGFVFQAGQDDACLHAEDALKTGSAPKMMAGAMGALASTCAMNTACSERDLRELLIEFRGRLCRR
jgi:hypothetical protein